IWNIKKKFLSTTPNRAPATAYANLCTTSRADTSRAGKARAWKRTNDRVTAPSAVSIIVPVYNGGKNWSRCLDALGALNPPPLEIIVVDDGSTDASADAAAPRGFIVVHTDQPQSGPARARNLGAAYAHGDILFFVDADVLVYPDAVARVTRALSDTSISAIFGSYDDTPDDSSFVSRYKNLMHHFVHQHSRTKANTFWAGCD